MVEIKKTKDVEGYDRFKITTENGSFDIMFGGNLDLYWYYWPEENYKDYEYSIEEMDEKCYDLVKYDDPDVRYYACVVDKNRAGAKPKLLFRLNLAYNRWEELGYLKLKQHDEDRIPTIE